MIDAGELKKGINIELNGGIYQVSEHQVSKMQQRQPVIRLKLRDLRSGTVLERTFQSGDKFTPAFLEHRSVQYLYKDDDFYYFMDNASYEQIMLTRAKLGEGVNYLRDGLDLEILTCKEEALSMELPKAVELRVVETEPGFKGDTATAGSKSAKLETGIIVHVPLFINIGDIVKVDTRSGEYLEKAG